MRSQRSRRSATKNTRRSRRGEEGKERERVWGFVLTTGSGRPNVLYIQRNVEPVRGACAVCQVAFLGVWSIGCAFLLSIFFSQRTLAVPSNVDAKAIIRLSSSLIFRRLANTPPSGDTAVSINASVFPGHRRRHPRRAGIIVLFKQSVLLLAS